VTNTLLRNGGALAAHADRQARAGARASRRWLIPLGRAGFAACGIVYGLVGVLAAEAALGTGGDTTDSEGVLVRMLQAPHGHLVLGAIACGLVGYAAWRFLQAALDTDHKGTGPEGLAVRAGSAVAGVGYVGLALTALGLLRGSLADANGDQATQDRTAWLMAQPFGPWLVGLSGLVVIGVGLGQLATAYRATFRHDLRQHEMSADERRLATYAGRLGFAARGVVFAILGGFLLVAAVHARPDEARGLGGVLATLAAQPYGPWLLGLVAVGLVAYGAFMLVEARYRRMVVD
jgi:hypothetical protein